MYYVMKCNEPRNIRNPDEGSDIEHHLQSREIYKL